MNSTHNNIYELLDLLDWIGKRIWNLRTEMLLVSQFLISSISDVLSRITNDKPILVSQANILVLLSRSHYNQYTYLLIISGQHTSSGLGGIIISSAQQKRRQPSSHSFTAHCFVVNNKQQDNIAPHH